MKPKEIREKTSDELKKQLVEMKENLFGLKFKKSIGQLEQVSNLKKEKRGIAKINTILKEREIQGKK